MVDVHSVHPAADAFPMMSDDELNALAVDIAANGLTDPIVMTPEDEVLDGRNRLEACRRIQVEPSFVEHDGDPYAFTRSKNLWRRNMTTGQRAAACALSLIAQGKRKDGRWARGSVPEPDSGGSANSDWQHRMKEAGLIADWFPELLAEVRDGNRALDAAYKSARLKQEAAAFAEEQERKKREGEIAAADAALAEFIGLTHNQLNIDRAQMLAAVDEDNWRGVLNLAGSARDLWNRLEEAARERLA